MYIRPGLFLIAGAIIAGTAFPVGGYRHQADAAAHAQRGAYYVALARYADAITEYERTLAIDGSHTGNRLMLAQLYAQTQQWQRARSALDTVVADAAHWADAWQLLGDVAIRQGDLERASICYEVVVTSRPHRFDAYRNLARVYLLLGNRTLAQRTYVRFIERHPYHVPARWGLAGLLLASGDIGGARGVFNELANQHPDHLLLLDELAAAHIHESVFIREHDARRAARTMRDVLVIDDTMPAAHLMLGLLHTAAGQPREAAQAYRRVADLTGAAPAAYQHLDRLRIGGERGHTALQLAQQAYAQQPDHPELMDRLGWLYAQRGALLPADVLISQAARRTANHPTIQYHLGVLRFLQGDYEAAEAALYAALASEEDFPEAVPARDALAAVLLFKS